MDTGGRVQFVGGDLYYSPNSTVDAFLQLEPLGNNISNAGEDRLRYKDLVHPRLWRVGLTWTAFIPVIPAQWYDRQTYLGRVLSRYPPLEHYVNKTTGQDGWAVDPENEWGRLEKDLHSAVIALSSHYNIPCTLPYLPTATGYTSMFTSKTSLLSRVKEAREWFLVWFGLLSYLVACARGKPSSPCQQDERWLTVLHSEGVSPTFVDALIHSLVVSNEPSVRRAGAVIDILDTKSLGLPEPKWFIEMRVPLWFKWSEAEERNREAELWRPPAHLLRQSKRSTNVSPPKPSQSPDSHCPQVTRMKVSASTQQEPEWVPFFKSRDAAHEQILKTESPKARNKRENYIHNTPTARAKVFEWFPSEKEGTLYERFPVPPKDRVATLDSYGETQKRYDSFFNEWDCCEEWGTDSDAYSGGEDLRGEEAASVPPALASSFVRVTVSPIPTHISLAEGDCPTEVFLGSEAAARGRLEDEVEETLRHFYGFSTRIPGDVPPSAASIAERDGVFLLRVAGIELPTPEEQPYLKTRHCLEAHCFIQSLCNREHPQSGSWDLRDECVRPVRLTSRFRRIREVEICERDKLDTFDRIERYYVFDEPGPWKLGVTSAASAILVCRLPPSHTAYDIAVFLSSYGIPFRTFCPARPLLLKAPPNKKMRFEIPKRPFDHKFTKDDYDAYVNLRTLVFGQSHMQAALKRGGIVWRLAVGTLGTSRVTDAPTLWGSSHSVLLSSTKLIDDNLTQSEMDLICGAYECVSDDGKRRALKSWWPLARYYEKEECGENYGRWTHRREVWYSKRLEAIEKGDLGQQPHTYTEWKSKQHGVSVIRSLHAYIERTSSELIETNLPKN